MSGTITKREAKNVGLTICIFATAMALGLLLDNHVGSHLIWGGSVCDITGEIASCFGYPPTGIILLIGLSFVIWSGVYQLYKEVFG